MRAYNKCEGKDVDVDWSCIYISGHDHYVHHNYCDNTIGGHRGQQMGNGSGNTFAFNVYRNTNILRTYPSGIMMYIVSEYGDISDNMFYNNLIIQEDFSLQVEWERMFNLLKTLSLLP